ncbi:ABC transporter ATP-binding protein [Oricola cellulosilytica]|uniref:sn-glycerol-3-phosphate ABC transporter ATP-binding protein UgpC n=1 Tax=Oricola cellulosilytica TaxID=1429082 RepID=A0A4R0PF39_9HYPH|nr:sn-glycerol-3-phosphate ABC transporter ATP-binding protein UgpC [Oricola cellulosilytica]TCD16445.1 sn-glycerol-3-phosphate ABC transporter ATP-binding protein UgpC [Oricola cellulosilytica]
MAELKLTNVQKAYGTVKVLHGIDLHIQKGEFIVFVGPSGCGKSTLLRCIAGLEQITGGTLEIDGMVVNDVPPSQRGIAMVFQTYALYPHMTVYDNMAFGLRLAKMSKDEIDKRVQNAANILQLTPYLDRLPKALSGGQRQRVAIGRSICRDPKVFLFDEPLSNLDAALRVATRIEIAKLNETMPDTTMIYVTHDQVEAMTLADRIVVLRGGYIEQVGSPMELYHRPANLFVAQFIGSPAMNILPATVTDVSGAKIDVDITSSGVAHLPLAGDARLKGKSVKLGVRPEDLKLAASGEEPMIVGEVDIVEALGEVTLLYVRVAGHDDAVIAKLAGDVSIKRGETVNLVAAPEALHLFDGDGNSLSAARRAAA